MRPRIRPVVRIVAGASVIYTTGNRKRLADSFARWERTKAFHKLGEADEPSVLEVLRAARDSGYF